MTEHETITLPLVWEKYSDSDTGFTLKIGAVSVGDVWLFCGQWHMCLECAGHGSAAFPTRKAAKAALIAAVRGDAT
jgi:hypothetical protein